MTPTTLAATWRHTGPLPPWRVHHDMLDRAARLVEIHGWETVGTAAGYDVQANESDVTLTIVPRATTPVPPDDLIRWLKNMTHRDWSVSA